MSLQGEPVGKAIHAFSINKNSFSLHEKTTVEKYNIDADINVELDKNTLSPYSMKMTGELGGAVDINLKWNNRNN